jgi:hypothetical protein
MISRIYINTDKNRLQHSYYDIIYIIIIIIIIDKTAVTEAQCSLENSARFVY